MFFGLVELSSDVSSFPFVFLVLASADAKVPSFAVQTSSKTSTTSTERSVSPLRFLLSRKTRRRGQTILLSPSPFLQKLTSSLRSPSTDAISNDPSVFPNTTHITHADPFIVLSPQEATYLFYAGPKETRVVRSELLKGGTLFFSKSGWNGTISPYHWLIEV